MTNGRCGKGGWDGRRRDGRTERSKKLGVGVDQHDVVPQPGKKRNKNGKHGLDRLYYTTEPRQQKGGEKIT